jgi:hypothetical protein
MEMVGWLVGWLVGQSVSEKMPCKNYGVLDYFMPE